MQKLMMHLSAARNFMEGQLFSFDTEKMIFAYFLDSPTQALLAKGHFSETIGKQNDSVDIESVPGKTSLLSGL